MDNEFKVLNYLGKQKGASFTMLSLSKLANIPYATLYRVLKGMGSLVTVLPVGKSKVVSLNEKNPVMCSYLSVSSSEEAMEFLKKKPMFQKIVSELPTNDVVLLFGSYAKGKERESSDIDILVINKKGVLSLSFSKYETLFKKKINPLFVTHKEFSRMLKEEVENVGKQVLKNHIVLNNPQQFWECVLNG